MNQRDSKKAILPVPIGSVELSADLATRLERNETPHRMECKSSKRDVAWSKANLLKDATNHRLNLEDGEI